MDYGIERCAAVICPQTDTLSVLRQQYAKMITSMIYTYADNTKLCRRVNKDLDIAALQTIWTNYLRGVNNGGYSYADQCKIIQWNLQATYIMASTTLETTKEEKDLRI